MSAVSEKPLTYKKAPPSVMEFQQCVLAILRQLSSNFTLEDFDKAFRSGYGPDASIFHFKGMRSVLVAVPTVLEKGETFSYVPSEPIDDAIGLQKLEDEIYEVTLAVTWYGYFYIRASVKKESEQRKEKKLKALQARILAVVRNLSMPFIAKGMESAYENRVKAPDQRPADDEARRDDRGSIESGHPPASLFSSDPLIPFT